MRGRRARLAKTGSDLSRLMRIATGQILPRARLLSFAALAHAQELYVLGVHPRGIVIFDGTRNEIVGQIETRGRAPKEIVPSPDGKFVYATTDGRAKLEVVNVEKRSVDRLLDITPPGYRLTIYGVVLNSKGDRLYVHVKPVRELMDRYIVDPPQIWSVDVATGKTREDRGSAARRRGTRAHQGRTAHDRLGARYLLHRPRKQAHHRYISADESNPARPRAR